MDTDLANAVSLQMYSIQEKSTKAKTNAMSSIEKGGCKQRLNKVTQKVCSTKEFKILWLISDAKLQIFDV